MIKFPIEIAGVMYETSIEPFRYMNENALGFCEHETCSIAIKEGLTPDRGFETFVHELTHAMLNEAGFLYLAEDGVHTEELVERFSKVMFQVILDNDFEEIKELFYRGDLEDGADS